LQVKIPYNEPKALARSLERKIIS